MNALGCLLVALVLPQEPSQGPPQEGTLFERLAPERTGIDFRSDFRWDHPNKHLYVHGYAGGGVALGDYDGDGRPDLFLAGQTTPSRLYRQMPGPAEQLRFEDVSEAAGIGSLPVWSTGATFADIDGDGDLDLSVCSYDAPNRLYVNDGDGHFVDEAAERGLAHRGASLMTSFADYDVDGDLDAHLVTYRRYARYGRSPRTRQVEGRVELFEGEEDYFAVQDRVIGGETQRFVVQAGERDRLYRNDGGQFTDVSSEAGIEGHDPGYSATWWDYDGDLLPDLYVCNDFWSPDRLYHNQGDGTFRDVVLETMPHTPWFSMGADFGDLDGDGLSDFIAADMAPTTHYWSKVMMGEMGDSRWFLESAEPRQYMRNAVYLNTGTERFAEVAFLTGLANTDWTWSIKIADLDNDGRPDVFATNGTANHSFDPDLSARLRELQDDQNRRGVVDPRERAAEYWRLYLEVPPREERNLAFRNLGDLAFSNASAAWGLDHLGVSFGAAVADLDRDGDLDLVVGNVGDSVGVYRNTSTARGVLVRLVGADANSHGLGARVTLRAGGRTQVKQLAPVRGFLSSNEPLLHFGLDEGAETPIEVTVEWPNGQVQRVADLGPGPLHTIQQPTLGVDDGSAPKEARPLSAGPWFEPVRVPGLEHVSRELPFDEYADQPLLPAKLSQSGPGLAWGDADGDGDDDLFIGGPAGQAGRLLVRSSDELAEEDAFVERVGPWLADAEREDTAVLWIDVDGDGRLDLFVGSGGVEFPAGDARYGDRVYLARSTSTGEPSFEAVSGVLPTAPPTSTGTAVAADFDGDGDLDLFLGSRVEPGSYPRAQASRLLRNDGGTFHDATATVAPALADAGLVTSALWSDVENDGDLDLLVVREWEAPALYRNEGERLVEHSRAAGLADLRGWWNSIASADLDADGDLDYVLGNAGLNTKYHASPEKPARLLRADFDDSGHASLVEAKAGSDGWLPVRGLSCSSDAMPFVREKLPTFHDFAAAGLSDIYPESKLASADVYEATYLAHAVLWNDGAGRFDAQPLPRLAQAAPIYGMVAGDFDADGTVDLAALQNSFQREPETGRWDGGLGLVLRGAGRSPEVLRADASGLVVPGDGTALTLTDLDGDGRPDLVGAQNEGSLVKLRSSFEGGRPLALRLLGRTPNSGAVGARVEWVGPQGQRTVAEIHAGSGYLAQSGPLLFLGRGDDAPRLLRVRWPDGTVTEREVSADTRRLELTAPASGADDG